MKLLYSGFSPFGGDTENPSQAAVLALPDTVAGAAVCRIILPVSFRRAPELLRQAIADEQPDAVLMTGYAAARQEITVEKIGINYADARLADNDGEQPRAEKLLKSAPDGLFATLPTEKIAAALNRAGIPAAVSVSAGSYVCNCVLYRTLELLQRAQLPIRAGFLHLPPVSPAVQALVLAGEVTVQSMENYTYILRCADGSLYTGWTNDLAQRLAAHNSGHGAKYTRSRLPVELVYYERSADREAAMSREWQLKHMSRAQKLRLLAEQPPEKLP